jgi:hypothetical protein
MKLKSIEAKAKKYDELNPKLRAFAVNKNVGSENKDFSYYLILDSGATAHICMNKNFLKKIVNIKDGPSIVTATMLGPALRFTISVKRLLFMQMWAVAPKSRIR